MLKKRIRPKVVFRWIFALLILYNLIFDPYGEDPVTIVGKDENSIFYEKISNVYFNTAQLPCFNIEIENKQFPIVLDTGFQGNLSISNQSIQQIANKSFLKTASRHGFRGKMHEQEVYKIPEMNLGNLTFRKSTLEKSNPMLMQEAYLLLGNENEKEVGLLGCLALKKATLFMDLGHSHVVICDSIGTFEDNEGPLDAFTKIPFSGRDGLIEFSAMTDNGLLHCLLDSGATANHIHTENKLNLTEVEMTLNRNHFMNFSKFVIEGKNFGPITFCPRPMKLPPNTQALVGMEFLSKHRVLIDFKSYYLYLAPSY